jgi:hypothetical protein
LEYKMLLLPLDDLALFSPTLLRTPVLDKAETLTCLLDER